MNVFEYIKDAHVVLLNKILDYSVAGIESWLKNKIELLNKKLLANFYF